jgi:hypothetical protein
MTPGFDEVSPYLFFPLCLPLLLCLAALVLVLSASHQGHLLLVSQLYRAHILLQAGVLVTVSFLWQATTIYHVAGADSTTITITSGSYRHLFTYCLAMMAQAALPAFAFLAVQWSLAVALTSVGRSAATTSNSYKRGTAILPTSSRSSSFSGEIGAEPGETLLAGSERRLQEELAKALRSCSQPEAELSGRQAAKPCRPLARARSLAGESVMVTC